MSNLLIVEDNIESSYMLEQLLAAKGHCITCVENGEKALESIRRDRPDVIISDIMMPVMNGFRLCRELKNDPALRHIPVIFYTATFTQKEDEHLAMWLGASRFVIKPTEGERFLQILDEVLKEYNQGILAVPDSPLGDEDSILEMYDSSVTRKLAETVEKLRIERKALKESEMMLKEAQEVAQMGHWGLNLGTGSLHWSDQVFRIFGMKLQGVEPTYEAFLDTVHPDDREFVDQAYQQALVRKTQYEIDYRLSLKGGTVKHVHEKCQTLFNDNGRPTSLVGTIQDITDKRREELEKKELENQLVKIQKLEALGTLAGGIAHDFNNILSAILGYGDMVLGRLEQGSDLWRQQNRVMIAGNRAKELVKQILAFSRHGGQELRPVMPHLAANEVMTLLRASIPTTIEIRHDINKDGVVFANPTQIQQIIMNLCTNAYQAMGGQPGILSISVRPVDISREDLKVLSFDLPPGKFIRIEVSDTGHGIPKDVMDKIFDPYFSTKKKGEGTGLGLAMVHGIVKSYGGHITVYSEVGEGTTFNVYLPQLITDDTVEPIETAIAPLPRGHERIMAVDDQEDIALLLGRMLNTLGYEVNTFTSSKKALEEFSQAPDTYDLLITDMTMPLMTGVELAQRALAARNDLPVILITGFSELITRESAEALGIAKYLMKPLMKKDLALAVREVLDQHSL